MIQPVPFQRFLLLGCLVAGFGVGGADGLLAKEPVPDVSPEGMRLQKGKDARLVYLMPGATFGKYQRVIILDSDVEFAKNWQRDYNANVAGLQGRVTTQDMDRMKAAIAAEFKKVFTKELETKGGYEVVDTPAPDVLLLRPAIIDLQVTAPDLQTADMRTTLVRSAGQMTLYLELWDSATNTILARIMDPQEDESIGGVAKMASRGANKAAVDEMLGEWAEKLRKHLDAARAAPGA